MARPRTLLCAALLCVLPLAAAKVQTGTLDLGQAPGRWSFLSGFGFGYGKGRWEIRFRLRSPADSRSRPSLFLELHLDERWEEVLATEPCQRGAKGLTVSLPPDGTWSQMHTGGLNHVVRPHIWYFAVSDCAARLPGPVDFEFRATQADGSELGVELQHMPMVSVAISAFLAGVLVVYTRRCWVLARTGTVHPVLRVLSAVIQAHFFGQLCRTFHLWSYGENGQGSRAADLLSELLFMLSQMGLTSLLILIAWGYSLVDLPSGKRVGAVQLSAIGVSVLHAVLVLANKLANDGAYFYHEHQGITGWVLAALRLGLFAWFASAVGASSAQAGQAVRHFLRQLAVAGSFYLLSYPVLIVVVKVFAAYLQHPVLHVGLTIMQGASEVWLVAAFSSRGSYFKASVLNSSFLPGGWAGSSALPKGE